MIPKIIHQIWIGPKKMPIKAMKTWQKKNPNFEYIISITRAEDSHAWNGRMGRIEQQLLNENIEKIEDCIYFLCGSKEFVDSIISMLQNLGVKREQIKTDVWG